MNFPSFMCIGVMRSGTSTLFQALSDHPRLIPPAMKEINFWSGAKYYSMGIRGYQELFPKTGPAEMTFEVSPFYLDHADPAAARIKENLPFLRQIIVLLRDPIRRAWSEFTALRGNVGADFNQDGKLIRRGFYDEHLRRWFGFFPYERFLIIEAERFFADQGGVMNEIFSALRIDPHRSERPFFWDPLDYRRRRKDRGYPGIPDQTKSELREIYRPHIRALEELLGRKFKTWEV